MQIIEYFCVRNDCYQKNVNATDSRYTEYQKNGPKKLMLHSIGCPQPNALVLAKYWNQSGLEVAVHAVLQADGTVYHCLPWDFRGWHAGGSANNDSIGVEMTEPDCIKYTSGSNFICSNPTRARGQVEATYKVAVELFAFLCKKYGLDPLADIISHKEGYKKGIASNHGDPEHLWTQLNTGYTMDTFRKAVKEAMSGGSTSEPDTPTSETREAWYRVRKSWDDAKTQKGAYKILDYAKKCVDKNPGYKVYDASGKVVYPEAVSTYLVKVNTAVLNVRKGPGTNYKIVTTVKKGDVYTIVGESDGWGKLKSGAGWIKLSYTKRI